MLLLLVVVVMAKVFTLAVVAALSTAAVGNTVERAEHLCCIIEIDAFMILAICT